MQALTAQTFHTAGLQVEDSDLEEHVTTVSRRRPSHALYL